MTRRRQALGREGEAEAARYLEARGYRILDRNVRVERVELDLVALDRGRIVIVEVKTRRASGRDGYGHHGAAAEAVDPRKQQRLRRGGAAWLAAHPAWRRRARGLRFDVVTCLRLGAAGTMLAPEAGPRNDDTARPGADAQWSIEHWRAAF